LKPMRKLLYRAVLVVLGTASLLTAGSGASAATTPGVAFDPDLSSMIPLDAWMGAEE